MEPWANMKSLQDGWFTFDNANAFSHVLMPYGFCVGLGFSMQTDHGMITAPQALVGYRGENEPHLHPESRSFDGTYTGMKMEWLGNEILVETADYEGNLYLKVTPISMNNSMTVHFYGKMLWKKDGKLEKRNQGFSVELCGESQQSISYEAYGYGSVANMKDSLQDALENEKKSWEEENHTDTLQMPQSHLPQMLLTDHMMSYALDKTVYFSVEKITIPGMSDLEKRNQIDKFIQIGKDAVLAGKAAYGEYAKAYDALRTVVAWDTIYVEETGRICTPVSRIWNNNWGGYVLFCWDTYFAALMSMLGSKELAESNALAITNEVTEDGFVPNFGSSGDSKSRDRSQPPVGSMVVLEMYKKYHNKEFLELVYDRLLTWNRWFAEHRMVEDGTLCWGSNPYQALHPEKYWETHDIGNLAGAILESGLDNSPMYDEATFDEKSHLMNISDVGLTGLYSMDCNALLELAQIMGREKDALEIKERLSKVSVGLDTLWNEETGMYCNKDRVTGQFSKRLSPTLFYALFDRGVPKERVDRILQEHFWNENEFMGEYILPMIARNDPAYPDQNYWRGRIWAPVNFLVYMALKKLGCEAACKALADKSNALLLKEWEEHGHVHENYNADTGEGCDVNNSDCFYHWGALLSYITLDYYGKI